MKPLISPENMRECERLYFQTGSAKSIDIMERAAQALADAISAEIPEGASIRFACGTGGNGGDGTACARLLRDRYRCAIVQPREPKHPDAVENLRRARECGVPIVPLDALSDLPRPAAWVDALFGTGLTRAPSGAEAALIRRMNADHNHGARLYAADIPSGLNGATGRACDPCVRADRTVTFQHLKTGLTLADGLDCCGEITVADVGFPPDAFPPDRFDGQLIEPHDAARLLPTRPRNIHKGDCGHLLIIAGSFGMAGAAAMCASAALRSGAGLVTIACARSIVPILQTLAPQAMCIPLAESDGAISSEALPELAAALKGKTAVAIGPGLTRRAPAEAVRLVLESGLPAVIDADALNLLAANPHLNALLKPHHILTPHPGEAARLLESTTLYDLLRSGAPFKPTATPGNVPSDPLHLDQPAVAPSASLRPDCRDDSEAPSDRPDQPIVVSGDAPSGPLRPDCPGDSKTQSDRPRPDQPAVAPDASLRLSCRGDSETLSDRLSSDLSADASGNAPSASLRLNCRTDSEAPSNRPDQPAVASDDVPPASLCLDCRGDSETLSDRLSSDRSADASGVAPSASLRLNCRTDSEALSDRPADTPGTAPSDPLRANVCDLERPDDPRTLSEAVAYARASCDLSGLAAARLDDPLDTARRLSGLGATALFKGASTVVCEPNARPYVSRSGCCGMARGGSGDILTGILGALLADKMDLGPALTAALASELHGLAGERAQAKYGSRAMNARDILEFLPKVFPR